MPYIPQERRHQLTGDGDDHRPKTAGELNFLLTELLIDYIHSHGLTYARINDVMGALESAKLEFYRRVAAPYEDQKIEENGDVYP